MFRNRRRMFIRIRFLHLIKEVFIDKNQRYTIYLLRQTNSEKKEKSRLD